MAIYLIKQNTGMTNRQIVKLLGGVSYSAIAKAYERFREELMGNESLQKEVKQIAASLSNVKG